MTWVAIEGDRFLIDGEPTYKGRTFRGYRIDGLLLNSRMVQATFDDANPGTRSRWAYPDTGVWDPERNVREFLEALPVYREHGLLAVTVNFQGGCPERYNIEGQPWITVTGCPTPTASPRWSTRPAPFRDIGPCRSCSTRTTTLTLASLSTISSRRSRGVPPGVTLIRGRTITGTATSPRP